MNLKISFLFLRRNLFLVIMGCFLGVAIFFLQNKSKAIRDIIFPQSLSIGMAGKYTFEDLPEDVTSLISFGLTKLSSGGIPEPAAAISWEIKEQGKQFIFHLDPLLHWQDKSPFAAKEVNYPVERTKISSPDDYTVVFESETPFSPLPALVSTPLFKKRVIGLGKSKVKKIRLNASFISSLLLETSYGKNIIFHFYPTQKELITAFKLGEVNCVQGLNSIEEIRTWPNLKIVPRKESDKHYIALFFNTQKPPFDNKRLRQALAYSIDKPEESTRIFTPISPLSWAYNQNIKTYPLDPEHARKIMAEALQESTTAANLKIQITTTFDLSETGEKIKNDWEKYLQIPSSLRILPFIPPDQEFDVILGYGLCTQDPDQYYFWHSQQSGNITKFSNLRVDKLLEEGRTTLNREERKRIYKDFQRFLLEELPAIFLFSPTTYSVCREDVPSLN